MANPVEQFRCLRCGADLTVANRDPRTRIPPFCARCAARPPIVHPGWLVRR